MNDDEKLAILREVRDLLREQTAMAKAHWEKHAAIVKRNQIISTIVLFLLSVKAAAWLLLK